MNINYIYSLSSSEDPSNIRYIGKTKLVNQRLKQHIKRALNKTDKRTYRDNWIKSELSKGNDIIYNIIEECNEEVWKDREKYWISQYKNTNLTNLTEGGETSSIVGEKHPMYNKIGSESPNFNLTRKVNVPKQISRRFRKSKSVTAYNLDGSIFREYKSIREACLDLNCRKENISIVCRKERKTYFGYKWEYSNNKHFNVLQIDNKMQIVNKFETFKEASVFTNVNLSNICRATKRCIKAGGYYWKVVE